MYKRKEALKIKEMVGRKKIFLVSSHQDFIDREERLVYFYDSKESRDIHSKDIETLSLDGSNKWERYDTEMDTYMLHMPLNTHYEQKVWVYQAKYRRKF